MGVVGSRFQDQGPEAAQLLNAVKRGEHLKALRFMRLMPESAQAISQNAKAAAVHSAVKRGYVNILQFLGELPSIGSSVASANAHSLAASVGLAAVGRIAPSPVHGDATRPQRISRLSQQLDSARDIRGPDPADRESWLNAVDRHGRTPLFTAVRYNRLEFVEGLLSLGADPWFLDRSTRGTALHLAAVLGHAPLVAAFLRSIIAVPGQRVALYDAQDMYGFTPLHYAAAAGHADVARILLDVGASYTAASQLLYDPSPGLRRLNSLANIAGRVGLEFGSRDGGGDRTGVLAVPCAPRSNPLHLVALRGDGVIATLVLQRFLLDTDGLSRAARERVTDPRTQLNKDGFQPYMLAGNAGHWHVAQLLIPHSRDDRHFLSRDRDFLLFFPLPEPSVANGSGVAGEGPPSLAELAARAWAGKLLTDIKSAEATVRQLQQQGRSCNQLCNNQTSPSVSCGGGSGGAGGGGVLGALRRRSGRCAAGSPPVGGGGGGGAATTAAVEATAAASATAPAVANCVLGAGSPGTSAASTPRTSASGNGFGAGTGSGGSGSGGRALSPLQRFGSGKGSPSHIRSAVRDDSRYMSDSLDLIPHSSGPSCGAAAALPPRSPPSVLAGPFPQLLAPTACPMGARAAPLSAPPVRQLLSAGGGNALRRGGGGGSSSRTGPGQAPRCNAAALPLLPGHHTQFRAGCSGCCAAAVEVADCSWTEAAGAFLRCVDGSYHSGHASVKDWESGTLADFASELGLHKPRRQLGQAGACWVEKWLWQRNGNAERQNAHGICY
ncbi:hypothetical protein VOLCADRAFT_87458 [Volvox carteri f. nagariensis]|uniref:Uncharacterized protein n=1 Tax=Volvox carteri f. nagariensis TaxID=3068 RepID=D8TLE1_VOLCA|nr:uncharacterized protein VOLCADRAFT_87458 [Volvox carteri f. nagariensis]EFJ51858.1 hypothetical protein VOLCADRAFT_87458 [Volvox carteri f. nagariensis]|eukprot:XP_002947268.1 hypothetical protein VOLCADRAFT_87458 [Volvox carteri f. nagariensis]